MTGSVNVTYFDTAMALIEIGGLRLLTDPVLDPAGAAFDYGPIHLQKTLGASTTAEALGRIDAVLLSHDQHGDNLDNAGRAFLATAPVVFTTTLAAGRLEGVKSFGLEPWSSASLQSADGNPVRITAMPAQHGPDGTQEATGPVIGFLLEHSSLSAPVYISGDTVRFSGTDEIARRHGPIGLALLHLGRVQLEPFGEAAFSLSAEEAAAYAAALQPRWIVPLHFEGWRHFSQGRAEAAAVLDRTGIGDKVHWLGQGETATFEI